MLCFVCQCQFILNLSLLLLLFENWDCPGGPRIRCTGCMVSWLLRVELMGSWGRRDDKGGGDVGLLLAIGQLIDLIALGLWCGSMASKHEEKTK